MNPSSPPLDRPASIPLLRRLLAANVLSAGETRSMEARLRRDLPWRLWLDRGLLALGVVLIVAGVGYFFAHNWQHLTDDDKLGLAGGAVLAALAGGTWAGLERFPGKLLLLAASMLVGVFLGVFGQIYETDADSYELFVTWAFLVFPWVALGRFMPLWLFWLGLINLAIGFYWPVSLFFDPSDLEDYFHYETISLFFLNLTALSLREVAGWSRIPWVDRNWSALFLLTAAIVPITVETTYEIGRTWDHQVYDQPAFLACVIYTGFIIGISLYYSRLRPSLPALAIGTLGACWVLTTLAARLVFHDNSESNSGVWFVMGVLVLMIFGGGIFFLRTMAQRISHPQ